MVCIEVKTVNKYRIYAFYDNKYRILYTVYCIIYNMQVASKLKILNL